MGYGRAGEISRDVGTILQRRGSHCVSDDTGWSNVASNASCTAARAASVSRLTTCSSIVILLLRRVRSFVVDASDPKLFPLAQKEMQSLLAQPTLAGVPLLVLFNKNDLPNAINPEEIVKELSVAARYISGGHFT